MQTIYLKTPSTEGNIHIGAGSSERVGELARGEKFAVTDSNVYAIYKPWFARFFSESEIFIFPAGEESKTFAVLGRILEKMTAAGLHRTATLFAVGGGVVGDIAGLSAALYMRGIKCVQVPTTLLSQVDSGVGGKTAVDLGGVKNVVGAFYQPEEVLVDRTFLKTLPEREIKCGLGEIVKYAALDGGFFDALKGKTAEELKNLDFLSSLIYPALLFKARVVESDEKETGERRCLNVGHTTGHAIELFYGLSHGESVLYGMLFETELAKKYGIVERGYADELLAIVRRALAIEPISCPDFNRIGQAAEKARSDKKNVSDGNIRMAVAKQKGVWTTFDLSFEEYVSGLEETARLMSKGEGQV